MKTRIVFAIAFLVHVCANCELTVAARVQLQNAKLFITATRDIEHIRVQRDRSGRIVVLEYRSEDDFFEQENGNVIWSSGDKINSIEFDGTRTILASFHSNTNIRTVAYGGPGSDVLIGGDNDDDLRGGHGTDYIYGGKGRDLVWAHGFDYPGDGAKDYLYGGDGEGDWYDGGDNDVKTREGQNAPNGNPRRQR